MNISVNWLRDLVPSLEGTAEELAHRLSMTAVTVDHLEPVGVDLDDVVVARVTRVRAHPDADRLTLCRVDVGSDERDVVCGAPHVSEGVMYPYVPPGGTLPGGLEIESRKIRGQLSHGMLCSERELGLGRDHRGIMALGPGLVPGAPLARAMGLPDTRFELDLTANRIDLASHVGVARELAMHGVTDIELTPFGDARWEPDWIGGEEAATAGGFTVAIDAPERCYRYLGAIVRGVRVGPSPPWLVARLHAIGQRPINNVVDATNYVLHELNQPLHAFDLDRLAGSELRVRAAREDERLVTLDGETRVLSPEVTVIADLDRAVALAGVMGGQDTEVTTGTRDVFIECAAFDSGHTRRTARRTALMTDASYRFERGIDAAGLESALVRCVELILDLSGGAADPVGIRVGAPPPMPRALTLRPSRVKRLLGLRLPAAQITNLLRPIGFEPVEQSGAESSDGNLAIAVPTWRGDVIEEVDLIEEVARRYGFDSFPEEERWIRPSTVPGDAAWDRADRVRELLSARGLLECRSSTLVPERLAASRGVSLLDPLSAEETHLRPAMVPVLLRRLEHNLSRGRANVRLYEIGSVFRSVARPRIGASNGGGATEGRNGSEHGIAEELRVGVVLTGLEHPRHWSRAPRSLDRWDLVGLAGEIAERLCGGRLDSVDPGDDGTRDDGADAAWWSDEGWVAEDRYRMVVDGRTVGIAGRVRADAYDAQRHSDVVFAAEFRLDAVRVGETIVYQPVSNYPAVLRDVAVAIPPAVAAADIEAAIREAGPDWLERLVLFDVYEGEAVQTGRSLAWSLVFRAPDRTLTDGEVDAAMQRIFAKLEERFDVRIRTS